MNWFKRLIYLGYYLLKLDWRKVFAFYGYVRKEYNISFISLALDNVSSVLRYNISILEYFYFRFWEKDRTERKLWAGTGYMYEFQLLMNPKREREILNDKRLFFDAYKDYIKHGVFTVDQLKSDMELGAMLLESEKIVLKTYDGKCGAGTKFIDSSGLEVHQLVEMMEVQGYDLAENYIEQHPDLMRLSPSGVNTVRIFTQLNELGSVDILGCRQRISVNCPVDNLAAGNLAAPIDENSGIISGPGVYSDIRKSPADIHPVTGVSIVGFQVPFWRECITLAKEAAKAHPQNKSIGWDIVVTITGPGLIEGNHDWCKLVWQLPVGKGLKPMLEKYV